MGIIDLFQYIRGSHKMNPAASSTTEYGLCAYLDAHYILLQLYDMKSPDLNKLPLSEALKYMADRLHSHLLSLLEKHETIYVFIDKHRLEDFDYYKADPDLFHDYLPKPSGFDQKELIKYKPLIHINQFKNIKSFDPKTIRLSNELFNSKSEEHNPLKSDYVSILSLETKTEKINEVLDHAWYRLLITKGAKMETNKERKEYNKRNKRTHMSSIIYYFPIIIDFINKIITPDQKNRVQFFNCLLEGETAIVRHILDNKPKKPDIYTCDTDMILLLGNQDCFVYLYDKCNKCTYIIHPPSFWNSFLGNHSSKTQLDLRVVKIICVLRGSDYNKSEYSKKKPQKRHFNIWSRYGFANLDGTGREGEYDLILNNYSEILDIMGVKNFSDIKFEDLKTLLLNSVKFNDTKFNRMVLLACNMYLQDLDNYVPADVTTENLTKLRESVRKCDELRIIEQDNEDPSDDQLKCKYQIRKNH